MDAMNRKGRKDEKKKGHEDHVLGIGIIVLLKPAEIIFYPV